jgi:hypothetical protein
MQLQHWHNPQADYVHVSEAGFLFLICNRDS